MQNDFKKLRDCNTLRQCLEFFPFTFPGNPHILTCTERKSTGNIRVKTLIFTVFDDNGGMFAWKVKFTVFTLKNLFSS